MHIVQFLPSPESAIYCNFASMLIVVVNYSKTNDDDLAVCVCAILCVRVCEFLLEASCKSVEAGQLD